MAKIIDLANYRGSHYKVEFDARQGDILYPNFRGEKSAMNASGYRNFRLKIDEEDTQRLRDIGMHVKDHGDGTYSIKVNVSYRFAAPAIFVTNGHTCMEKSEATVGEIDGLEIVNIPHCVITTSTSSIDGSETAYICELEVEKRYSAWRENITNRMAPAPIMAMAGGPGDIPNDEDLPF